MKTYSNCFSVLMVGAVFSLVACADSGDNRPVPGTVQATTTKDPANENNTPRTNPTPNPEPASNPPGPQSDVHPVGTTPPQ
jgi:hypothetical protein